MAENFRLDVAELSAALRRLEALGEHLGSAFGDLTGVLDQHSGCWGEDDIGKAFAKNYVPAAEQARRGAGQVIDSIDEVKTGTGKAAETFASVDHDAAARLDAPTDS